MLINLNEIIAKYYPTFLNGYPELFRKIIYFLFGKILHINEINNFMEKHHDKKDIPFIDEILEYTDFSYIVSKKDRDKIPSEGRLLIIANHPLGGLDGLILLKLISEVRNDVKIIVNEIVKEIDNLNGLFLPYNINEPKIQRNNIHQISISLLNEHAIIIFPAGEVSRYSLKGIRDLHWHKGVLYLSKKYNAPVLPVFIKAKNSFLFYFVSILNKKLSTFLLPYELLNKSGKSALLKIGDPISPEAFGLRYRNEKLIIKLLKKHLVQIGKNKKGIFQTEKNIVHPVDKKILNKQIESSELLGETSDNKFVYLVHYNTAPIVVTEIARLREITFRKVGEGTGKKMDTDKFDRSYDHIVLWDDNELEIVGSYRLAFCDNIINEYGTVGLYTSTLFNFSDNFISKLPYSVELGRSFIQSKYWNTNALDSLWQGIGLYLNKFSSVKYLFGAVSIGNKYPDEAKSMIVHFYNKWFWDYSFLVSSKNKYAIPVKTKQNLNAIFNGDSYHIDFQILKKLLKNFGLTIPVLFKQYSKLCLPGGVAFSDFNVDGDFQNCLDGFIFLQLSMLKESKRKRYINGESPAIRTLLYPDYIS